PVPDHSVKLLFSETDQRSRHPALAAVAEKPGRIPVIDLQAEIPQNILQNRLRRISHIHKSGNRSYLLKLSLQSAYDLIRGAGHELEDKSSGLAHRIVLIHQNA